MVKQARGKGTTSLIYLMIGAIIIILIALFIGGLAYLIKALISYLKGFVIGVVLLMMLSLLRRTGIGKKSKLFKRITG